MTTPRIIETSLLFWADGFTVNQNLILTRPGFRTNQALVEHEKKHIAQIQRDGLWTFRWRYLTSRKWRQTYEVEAYRVSMANGVPVEQAAYYLSTKYWLGITRQQAIDALTAPITTQS